MARRLPLCAHCGCQLRGASVRLLYQGVRGRPKVGWHSGSCLDGDEVFSQLVTRRDNRGSDDELRDLLMTVHERGEGRLVASKAWWKQ